MRILHTSDIHLRWLVSAGDSGPYHRAGRALIALIDLSLETGTDLIIIAGDFFDDNQIDAAVVEFALREFRRALVPVIILPGNHDCLVPDSIYRQVCFSELAPNVCVYTDPEGETFSFPELDLAVWGKPLDCDGGDLRPLAGIPPRGEERWQIAVAHGYYVGDRTDHIFSFQISEEEILHSGRDYVALGHSGYFRCVCDGPVKAYYGGSASETGVVAIVDMSEDAGVQVRSHKLSL